MTETPTAPAPDDEPREPAPETPEPTQEPERREPVREDPEPADDPQEPAHGSETVTESGTTEDTTESPE